MMIHFVRPYCLLLLLPTLVYLLWVIYSRGEYNPWKKVCDPHLLESVIVFQSSKSRHLSSLALFLFYIISVFALAGPAWKKAQLPVYQDIHSMMLVLDLSPMMNEIDLKPNRITRAKYKIRDLLTASQNLQMGLVVFTKEAFIASPLSKDANTLNALLDKLSPDMMPISGSDSSQGLIEGYRLLKQGSPSMGSLLLITASNPTTESFRTVKTIIQGGSRLNVLGMLENNVDNQTTIANLKQLAKAGGGDFYLFTSDMKDIQNILNHSGKKDILKNENIENPYLWLDEGPWFCLLLIPIGLLILREKIGYEKN